TYDKWGRLSVHYPLTTDTQEHKVKVHSKVMIVDDQTVMMGSANLNERSMGLDTELNFIFSAVENPRVRDHIQSLKKKSLGCFLGKELREDELTGKKLQQTIDASPSFQRFRENKKSSTLELWADENLPLDYKE